MCLGFPSRVGMAAELILPACTAVLAGHRERSGRASDQLAGTFAGMQHAPRCQSFATRSVITPAPFLFRLHGNIVRQFEPQQRLHRQRNVAIPGERGSCGSRTAARNRSDRGSLPSANQPAQ